MKSWEGKSGERTFSRKDSQKKGMLGMVDSSGYCTFWCWCSGIAFAIHLRVSNKSDNTCGSKSTNPLLGHYVFDFSCFSLKKERIRIKLYMKLSPVQIFFSSNTVNRNKPKPGLGNIMISWSKKCSVGGKEVNSTTGKLETNRTNSADRLCLANSNLHQCSSENR